MMTTTSDTSTVLAFVHGSCLLALATLLVLCAAAPLGAHSLEFTQVLVIFKSDGTYQVDMTCDLDALALGASPTADDAELAAALRALAPAELEERLERLRGYFERRVRVTFDDQRQPIAVAFPEHGTTLADEADPPTVLGLTARLEGRVPRDARSFSFRASRAFPPVHLTILRQDLAVHRELVEKGVPSVPYSLAETAPSERRGLGTAGRYLALGFRHIVPEGLDHILFVLGLFLLSARLGPLLWQVSAFTAAHTLTLALSTYGVVAVSPRIVEPLIALSIAWVAVENLFTTELKPWRPALVFVFGLLHGLGFAGVLAELGLPREDFLTALLAFNGGVELGQLTVILAAFAVLGGWRRRDWYHRRVVVPLSLLIALTGLYWAIERSVFT